jgi:prepilin-type N-terminal cleavage/methylation domain-containing protein
MRKSARAGFTLLEIMIVMVMIAIVARMALPRMQISQYRADGAMRTVQSVLMQAERGAVQRQMEVAVSFDTTKRRLRVHYDVNGNRVIDTGEESKWTPLEEGNRFAAPPTGVNGTGGSFLVSTSIPTSPDGYPTIYYHRDGAASSNFEVYLRSSSSLTSDFRALVVTQATGRVELYRYTGSAWRKSGL